MQKNLKIRKLSRALGAELVDADIKTLRAAKCQAEIQQLLDEYSVLTIDSNDAAVSDIIDTFNFLGQYAIEQQDVDAGLTLPDYPECLVTKHNKSNPPQGTTNWHCDRSPWEKPVLYTILTCHKCPEIGGDTLVSNTRKVFSAFSPQMQSILRELKAVYNEKVAFYQSEEWRSLYKNMGFKNFDIYESSKNQSHPIVMTNARNGHESVYFSPSYFSHIDGMNPSESKAFKELLTSKICHHEYIYQHQWHEGQLMIIDNMSTCHRGVADYYPDERIMYRLIIH